VFYNTSITNHLLLWSFCYRIVLFFTSHCETNQTSLSLSTDEMLWMTWTKCLVAWKNSQRFLFFIQFLQLKYIVQTYNYIKCLF